MAAVPRVYAQVIGGSLLMMLGVGAIAFSSATGKEQTQWREAAQRECQRYGVAADYVEARMEGRQASGERKPTRNALDWLLVGVATSVFIFSGAMARVPQMSLHWGAMAILSVASVVLLLVCGVALWRTTRFQ
jgi:hypothetical protein